MELRAEECVRHWGLSVGGDGGQERPCVGLGTQSNFQILINGGMCFGADPRGKWDDRLGGTDWRGLRGPGE